MKLLEREPASLFQDVEAHEQPLADSDVMQYWMALWRRKWIFLATWIVVALIGIGYARNLRKTYVSSTSLVIASRSGGESGSGSIGESVISNLLSLTGGLNVQTQVALLKSPDLLEEAFSKLSVDDRIRGFGTAGGPPRWAVTIDSAPDTQMITIGTRSYDPRLAANLATNIAHTYLQRDKDRNSQATRQGREFVQGKLLELQRQLNTDTLNLANYQTKSGIVIPDLQAEESTKEIYQLQDDKRQAQLAVSSAQLTLETLDKAIKKQDPSLEMGRTITENPEFGHLQEQLGLLNDQLVAASQEFKPDRPEIKKLRQEIKDDEDRLKQVARTIVTAVQDQRNPLLEPLLTSYATNEAERVTNEHRLKVITALLGSSQRQYLGIPRRARTYAELKRRSEALAHTLETLTDKYYELLITEESNIPNALVSSVARPPLGAASPNLNLSFALSILVGLLAAIAVSLAAETADRRIHDPATVERLTGLPVLGAIPETLPTEGNRSLLIDHVDAGHAFLEAFRLLRNNVAFSNPDAVKRVLAITSAEKGDGKSTVSANFGISCGMDGKSVLIVDADLRRPSLHRVFGVERDRGLTNVVAGTASLEDAIIPTGFENVSLLPSGPLPPRPTEFLNSSLARDLIDRLKSQYDIVILDSPPCAGLSDFQVISRLADGCLLVVCLEHTVKQGLWAASRMLRQSGAPMLGCAINRMTRSWNPYGAYNYYYYYYSYYGEDEGVTKRKRKKPVDSSNGKYGMKL